jgi:LysM repeat protein
MKQLYRNSLLISLSLILALLVSMVGFAPAVQAQSSCGSTYTVRSGDTLTRIAQQCGVTVQALLDANAAITNRNLIRTGQVIQIPGAPTPPPGDDVPGDPQALLIPNNGPAGTEVEVRISGFPASQEVTIALGVEGVPPLEPTTATTNAQGRVQTNVTIPETAQVGERWVATVRSTGAEEVGATSNIFLVGTGEESVSITPTSGPVGAEIQVNATGFPANVPVNVGIGRSGSEPTVTESAQTDAQGNVNTTITLPTVAEPGREWRVVVGTQGWRITALSEIFTVTGEPVNGDPDQDFIIHTVQRGEWLSRIARQYNTTVSAILAANPNISNPNRISVGQQIRIPSGDAPAFTSANIYLIAVGDGGQRGPEIGCNDSVVPVEVQFAATVAPLTAVLEQLFAADGDQYGLYNVFERSQLSVQGINIANRHATVELTGQLSIGGVCDGPRVEAQLERTALQFDTVDSASFSINGESLSDILSLR